MEQQLRQLQLMGDVVLLRPAPAVAVPAGCSDGDLLHIPRVRGLVDVSWPWRARRRAGHEPSRRRIFGAPKLN